MARGEGGGGGGGGNQDGGELRPLAPLQGSDHRNPAPAPAGPGDAGTTLDINHRTSTRLIRTLFCFPFIAMTTRWGGGLLILSTDSYKRLLQTVSKSLKFARKVFKTVIFVCFFLVSLLEKWTKGAKIGVEELFVTWF